MPDYRLVIREVYRAKLSFAELPDTIELLAEEYNYDGKLRGVIIEDKASGISALQTLQKKAALWLRPLLVPFMPNGDKARRATQVTPWCFNDCVLLPHPSEAAPWQQTFEQELFSFPGSLAMDQVDSFVQLLLYLEHILSSGYHARN